MTTARGRADGTDGVDRGVYFGRETRRGQRVIHFFAADDAEAKRELEAWADGQRARRAGRVARRSDLGGAGPLSLNAAGERGQPMRVGGEGQLGRAGELLDRVLEPQGRPAVAAAPRDEERERPAS